MKRFIRDPLYFKFNHTNTYLRQGNGLLVVWDEESPDRVSCCVSTPLWSNGQEVRIRVKTSLVNRVNTIRISLCRRKRLIHISEGGTSFLACVKKVLTETPAVLLLLCDQLDKRWGHDSLVTRLSLSLIILTHILQRAQSFQWCVMKKVLTKSRAVLLLLAEIALVIESELPRPLEGWAH